jgi:DNA-binding NarL/FixJ family response regulator
MDGTHGAPPHWCATTAEAAALRIATRVTSRWARCKWTSKRWWTRRGSIASQEADAMLKLVELGWGRENTAFRQVFATQFIPDGTTEQLKAFDEMQRKAVTPETAARILSVLHNVDVTAQAARVQCPTLVLHSRGDARIPFEEGRMLAAAIPGAEFVPLDSQNHILMDHQSAWERFFVELEDFLARHGAAPVVQAPALAELTPAESRVLDLLAAGLNNERIAHKLEITPKTVRNHINHIFHKLGVEDRAGAIVLAREHGLGAQR